MDIKKIVEGYLNQTDWRVKENSSIILSVGGLDKHIKNEISKEYWLENVYPEHIKITHRSGDMHIHDLGGLTLYCTGYSLKSILTMGVQGVSNIPKSKPAKHFKSINNQICNLTTIYQNEIMGAVAFNSVDTLLAPFIKEDKLSYDEVKQEVQNLVFSINSNSRGGAEASFSNMSFDLCPTESMLNEYVIHGGKLLDYTYKEVQNEMNMFNKAFFEVMLEGDADGKPFSYPIPSYNINKRFNWDNPNNDLLWEMAGKYGYPYFSNFINSELDPDMVRSMCCRLRLDLSELSHRNGGLFGSADSTGSIGVVTINLPRLGYLHDNLPDLIIALGNMMDIASESLEIKRKWLQENILNKGLIPAFQTYVGDFRNHFSTIGIIGMNELCENFIGKDIARNESIAISKMLLNFMRDKIIEIQERTGTLYNLEATPAEGTCYSLAKKDKEKFPDIKIAGEGKNIYYTNSTNLPVSKVRGITQLLDHQETFQKLYTGGTVTHIYLNNPISGHKAKSIIKYTCENYTIPYISLSPLIRTCPEHGQVVSNEDFCSCGKEFEKYQRVTGYIRDVKNFNIGKAQEFKERSQL